MKLSAETQQKLECFFRLYFADENLKLPKVEIYLSRGAKILTKIIRVDGITLGRRIFINPRLAFYNETNQLCLPKNLLSHELVHVIQYEQSGFFRFLLKYVADYFAGLQKKKKWDSHARLESYWEIPHEIEARDAARKFVSWLKEVN